MNHFDRLPNELVFIIFKNLNTSDLFNLRILNKRFKSISEEAVTELVVFDDLNYGNYWFRTYDLKHLSRYDLIKTDQFSSFRSLFKLESSLKRLHLYVRYGFEFLNGFKQLEHLELDCDLSKDTVLNLPKLATLLIKIELKRTDSYAKPKKRPKLRLESVKLEAFYIVKNFGLVQVNNPNNVKYLKTDNRYYNDIKQFKNLEHLCLIYEELEDEDYEDREYILDIDRTFDKRIMSEFDKLKVIDFDLPGLFKMDGYDLMSYVLKQLKVLRRIDLVIRLNGVKMDHINQINIDCDFSENGFRFENYDLLTGYLYDDTYFFYKDYERMVKVFDGQVPISFFNMFFNLKFICLQSLDAREEDRCIWFLNGLICIRRLVVSKCMFSQSFYDKLISLKYLNSLDCSYHNVSPLDFVFITKFKELENFHSESELKDALNVALRAFKQSKFFKKISFVDHRNIKYEISKIAKTYQVAVKDVFECNNFFTACDLDELSLIPFENDFNSFLTKFNVKFGKQK